MKNEEGEIICSVCGKKCAKSTSQNITWFGEYENDKRIKVICTDCKRERKAA